MSLLGGVLFEYAVEMTYPLPESVSAGLVNFSFQVRALMIIINCLLRHENISLIKPYRDFSLHMLWENFNYHTFIFMVYPINVIYSLKHSVSMRVGRFI